LRRCSASRPARWSSTFNYKKYHWLTFGPHFRDLHLLFEEHGTRSSRSVDELAERALMIDGKPLADPSQYLPASLVPASQGERAVKQMVDEAIAAHDTVIKAMHDDADIATKARRHRHRRSLHAPGSKSTRSSGVPEEIARKEL